MKKRACLFALALVLSAARQAAAQEVVIGDFTKTGGGWQAAHHLKDVSVSAAGMSFTVTDNDPWLLGPKVSIPAAPDGATKVRFTVTCEPTMCASAWEVYYDLDGKGYGELKRFTLRACGSAPCTQFIGDMPAKDFTAVSGTFRIDPPAAVDGRFTVKSFTAEMVKPVW